VEEILRRRALAGRIEVGGHLPQLNFNVGLLTRAVVHHEAEEEVGKRQELLLESRVK
jgi:hypothetical protein